MSSSSPEKDTTFDDSFTRNERKVSNNYQDKEECGVKGNKNGEDNSNNDHGDSDDATDNDEAIGNDESGEDNGNADNDDNDPPLSEYELLRLRNIERNNRRLAELGLLHIESSTNSSSNNGRQKSKEKKNKKKRKRSAASDTTSSSQTAGPVRRSTRLRGGSMALNNPKRTQIISKDDDNSSTHLEENILKKEVEKEEEKEDRYRVSPLFQYDMSEMASTSSTSLHDMATTTTSPTTTNSSILTNATECVDQPPKSLLLSDDTSKKLSMCTTKTSTTNIAMEYSGTRLIPPKGLGAIYSLSFYEDTPWIVGAGKSGYISVWNQNDSFNNNDDTRSNNNAIFGENNATKERCVDPILSWKAHSGRWIADARFLPMLAAAEPSDSLLRRPSRLVTAGNDGTVCLWDLSRVDTAGAPKLLHRSGKEWHTSGIFSMDVKTSGGTTAMQSSTSGQGDVLIATGSKDKTISIRSFDPTRLDSSLSPSFPSLWRTAFHTAKVGCVQFQPHVGSSLIASASDDGIVAVHDFRSKGGDGSVSARIDYYSDNGGRPHSAVWVEGNMSRHMLATAGLNDRRILLWDLRNLSEPVKSLDGHVPLSTTRCKKIIRPTIWSRTATAENLDKNTISSYVFTGGEGSGSMSTYTIDPSPSFPPLHSTSQSSPKPASVVSSHLVSRARLPHGSGDVGCIAVRSHSDSHLHFKKDPNYHDRQNGLFMAVSVDDGEVLLLTSKSRR